MVITWSGKDKIVTWFTCQTSQSSIIEPMVTPTKKQHGTGKKC
jgi:hypothetical protein